MIRKVVAVRRRMIRAMHWVWIGFGIAAILGAGVLWARRRAAAPRAHAENTVISPATATTRLPVLKLKFGGVRHRVSKEDGEVLIGRESDSNILVASPHVSRHHAKVIWDSEGYPLLVNFSRHGTSVHVEGRAAPFRIDDSFRFEGRGRIGLYGDFATAEANGTVVDYDCKWGS